MTTTTTSKNNRIMIVDCNNQFIRSYIVDPSLSSMGNPIGGMKGFLKILNKLCRDIEPDMLLLVWDGFGGSRKRRAINKNYKDGRKPPRPRLNRSARNLTPEEETENKFWQQTKVIQMINNMPVMQFLEDEVEADDVISYLKSHPQFSEYQKVIVSSDKDFIQILDENTVLYRPTQSEVLNTNRIIEKFNIHPTNFALARSLVGDKSDNIEGLKGVGLKTVAKNFPFLSENKSYYMSDLKSSLKEGSRMLQLINDSQEKLDSNYKIMQLYSPLMSASLKSKITSTIQNWYPEYNKTELRKEMAREGFGELKLDSLNQVFNKIISNFN